MFSKSFFDPRLVNGLLWNAEILDKTPAKLQLKLIFVELNSQSQRPPEIQGKHQVVRDSKLRSVGFRTSSSGFVKLGSTFEPRRYRPTVPYKALNPSRQVLNLNAGPGYRKPQT